MPRTFPTLVGLIAAAGVLAGPPRLSARGQQPPPPQAPTPPRAEAQTQPPAEPAPFARASDALERVTWRTRTLVGDERLTRWKFAIRPDGLTFLDAVVRADAAVVDFVEGRSTQRVSATLPKPLDRHLTPEEIATIRGHMGSVKMLTYRVDKLKPDAAARRSMLQFAKAMGAETVVVPVDDAPAGPASADVAPKPGSPTAARHPRPAPQPNLEGLATLADDAGITIAVLAEPDQLQAVVTALQGQSPRVGVGIDTGAWLEANRAPSEALAVVGDRLRYLNLRDRTGRGTSSHNARLGEGAAQMDAFFQELNRRNLRPLAMTLDTTGIVSAPADLFQAIDAFERTVQPAYGHFFTEYSMTRPTRWGLVTPAKGETLTPEAIERGNEEARHKIEAALPTQAYATPKKRRTLLVIESLHGMSHNTIPHANVMLQRFGEITGAWHAVFSNDLTNLIYPKVKDYDGIFLNSIVGEAFADPAVRDGLLRFVKEGGGLMGIHGTPWASRNWDAFADLIGAQDAPHRIEQGVIRVYDPSSPLVKPLVVMAQNTAPTPSGLDFKEEYYRFHIDGPKRLRWNDVRVLLTVDLDDPKIESRPWTGYTRPDKIYPVSWIRTYGKGRVFYTSIGHMPETFMTPGLVGHFLAGVQYALGDLEADATPNPPGPASVSQ